MKKLGLWMVSVLLAAALLLGALAEAGAIPEPEAGPEPEAAAAAEIAPAADEVFSMNVEDPIPETEDFYLSWEPEAPVEPGEMDIAAPEDAWDDPEADYRPSAEAEYQVSAEEGPIELYYLYDELIDRIALPDGAQTSYRIQAAADATFEVKDMKGKGSYKSLICVFDDGLVLTQSGDGNYDADGYVSSEVVIVKEGNSTREVQFSVVNYARIYADRVMDNYLAAEITSGMTDLDKLMKVTEICARDFDYIEGISGYIYLICFGGADCWGSTSFICEACRRLGIKAEGRDARSDPGAGSGHMNVLAEIDGKRYIAEAGFDEEKPRLWYVKEENGRYSQYSTVATSGAEQGNTSADVLSAQFEALCAVAGKKASFSVSTGTGARSLCMFDESGNQLASWTANGSHSVLSGSARLWKVKYAFPEAGTRAVDFRASDDGGQLSEAKRVELEVRGCGEDIISAGFAVERAAVNEQARVDVVTGRDVLCLYVYDGGELKWIWSAYNNRILVSTPGSKWSTTPSTSSCFVLNGQRVWKIWQNYDAPGNIALTLRPATEKDGEQGEGKTIGLSVTPCFPLSVELKETSIEAGDCICIDVTVPNSTWLIALFREDGTLQQEVSLPRNIYRPTTDAARKTVICCPLKCLVKDPGDYTWSVKCAGEDGEYGEAMAFSFHVAPKPTPAPTPAPAAAKLTLKKNTTKKLTAGDTLSVKVSGGKLKSWSSSNKAVATVSKKGQVTAVAAGTAKLTARLKNGKKLVLTVKVSDPNAPTAVEIGNGRSAKLKVGKKLQLEVWMYPLWANGTITLKSSNPKVASVSNKTGIVTAKKAGTAKITASTQNGKKAVITIRVVKK